MKRIIAVILVAFQLLCCNVAFAECKWTDLTCEVVTTEKRLNEIISYSTVIYEGISYALINGERVAINENDSSVKISTVNDQLYIPVRFVADAFGGKCEYYADANKIYLYFNNFTMHFLAGSGRYFVNDTLYTDENSSILIGNVAYISDSVLKKIIDRYFYYCDNGVIIISPVKFKLDDSSYQAKASLESKAAAQICYDRPNKETIASDLAKTNPNKQHPRILIDSDRKTQILSLIKTDENFKRWAETAISSANLVVADDKVVEYVKDNRSTILEISRTAQDKFRRLSMAYLLTGERKYVDRAWKEFEAVAAFPDWNPYHFLDVGEMSAGVAIMYDWMYDALTEEQKQIMQAQMKEKSLDPAMECYEKRASNWGYFYCETNWNAVCNGGAAMVALAIADEEGYSDYACDIIARGLEGVEGMMPTFAPQGAWNEGLGYWGYTMQFFGYHMSSLIASCGSHYGIMYSPGVNKTAYYPLNMKRPNGSYFSFGDGGSISGASTAEWSLLAWIYNDTALQKIINDSIRAGGGGFYELCYYHPEIEESDSYLSMDNKYLGSAEIVTMRGGWDDPNAIFAGLRGGYMWVNHAHADVGSFVFDAEGVEWFGDFSVGNYAWSGYFSRPTRFLYYPLRAEAHNMVIVNPDDGEELQHDSTTSIDFETKQRGAIAKMDMTNTYASDKDVKSAKRAMAIINDRSGFIVQDEIETNNNGEFYWFAHTKAETITLSDDGKSAVLESSGKKLYVEMLSPANGVFTVEEDKPLETSPQFDYQESSFNPSVKKLRIHIEDTDNVTFSVFMMPIKENIGVDEYVPELTAIDDWTIPDGEIPHIDSLKIDGQTYLNYDMYGTNATVYFENESETAPFIEAKSEKYELEIKQAETVPGTAVISMYSGSEHVKNFYVNFSLENSLGLIETKKKYKVVNINASATPESQNSPPNLIDNNINTKWAAMLDQWVVFDLGEVKEIDTIGIGWYLPDQRISPFEVEVSSDGENWYQVYKGKSSGTNTEIETYEFDNSAMGRFVRLNVHGYGNPPSGWNSIMEVCIYGPVEGE